MDVERAGPQGPQKAAQPRRVHAVDGEGKAAVSSLTSTGCSRDDVDRPPRTALRSGQRLDLDLDAADPRCENIGDMRDHRLFHRT